MTFRKTPLERAFELARSGEFASVSDVRARLRLEGYPVDQVSGPSLNKQLRTLCTVARTDGCEHPRSTSVA